MTRPAGLGAVLAETWRPRGTGPHGPPVSGTDHGHAMMMGPASRPWPGGATVTEARRNSAGEYVTVTVTDRRRRAPGRPRPGPARRPFRRHMPGSGGLPYGVPGGGNSSSTSTLARSRSASGDSQDRHGVARRGALPVRLPWPRLRRPGAAARLTSAGGLPAAGRITRPRA